jgi:tight adherence protein B
MVEALTLLVVFSAVGLAVWVVVPLLVDVGLWRADVVGANTGSPAADPLFRVGDPRKLIQSCWASALLWGGIFGAIVLATGFLGGVGAGIGAVMVGLIGYQLPRAWLRRRLKIRQQLFEARLMDLTLGLANGLRSGASLPQTLELVTRDIGGPMGEEFALVLQEYRFGIDLPEALSRLCKRMPSEDLNLLMSAVRLTMQAGGSLAEVLDKITSTIRERTAFHERLLTMTAQGKFEAIAMAAAPAVAFLLLFWIDPNLMRPLIATKPGWCALGVVAVLETIGFFIINKIVTIEV